MVKNLPNHTYTWLNKWQIKEFKDYITLLKEGFLFNLNFDKIKIENYSKGKIISILSQGLNIEEKKQNTTELKEKIYTIFKKIINYDYTNKNISTKEVFYEIITNFFQENNISPDTINEEFVMIIMELYKQSSFLTRLDLMSVKGISKEEFKKIIFEEFQLNPNDKCNDKKALSKINKTFQETILIMKNHFKLNIPKDYLQKKWISIDEFIDFAFSTNDEKKTWYKRIIDCAILKTMNACNNIIENPLLYELDSKIEKIIEKFIKIPWLTIINEKKWEINFSYNNLVWWDNSYCKWKINYRTKEDIKILLKLLYNRKYTSLEFFKDLLQFRIEIENEKDWENIVLLLKNLFSWEIILKNKKLFNSKTIENLKNGRIKVVNEKKSWASDDFINASISWHFTKEKWDHWVIPPAEIQIVYTWNKNESWYNKHEIYDLKKYISAISRLFGYITLEQIKWLIKHFWLKSWLEEKWILFHLLNTSKWKKSFLMKARFTSKWKTNNYFLSRDIYDEKLTELYKDTNIEFIDINNEEFEWIFDKYIKI